MQSANWGDNCVTILGTFGLFYASWKINAKVSFLICITRLSNIVCIGKSLDQVRSTRVICYIIFSFLLYTFYSKKKMAYIVNILYY